MIPGLHSWLYPVVNNFTTSWEGWSTWVQNLGYHPQQHFRSFNHLPFAAVGEWVWSVVGGINADESTPGFQNVLIKPEPGGGPKCPCLLQLDSWPDHLSVGHQQRADELHSKFDDSSKHNCIGLCTLNKPFPDNRKRSSGYRCRGSVLPLLHKRAEFYQCNGVSCKESTHHTNSSYQQTKHGKRT